MASSKNGPKKGDQVEFEFHGFGLTSTEPATITKVTKEVVEIDHTNGDDENFRFSRKTGKCLNDSTAMGCWRTLPAQYR